MCDHRRVFDTGNDLDLATATFTGFDVDIENSLDYCADCGLEELLKKWCPGEGEPSVCKASLCAQVNAANL